MYFDVGIDAVAVEKIVVVDIGNDKPHASASHLWSKKIYWANSPKSLFVT